VSDPQIDLEHRAGRRSRKPLVLQQVVLERTGFGSSKQLKVDNATQNHQIGENDAQTTKNHKGLVWSRAYDRRVDGE
jgi:hypothetical protein